MSQIKVPTRAARLRKLLTGGEMSFLMEVHSALSAKIAEEAGFKGLWGSGLSLSAAMGVRDNNELSWTQVLAAIEYISDATTVPLLLDGDTGYGNFNNMRRLVKKLESLEVAGVCIEDKLFPKTNSFISGERQPLADIEEFAGKIKAGKDAQTSPDFCVVARVEAFIAGWGLGEALKRAEAYHAAGADAILIHSALSKPDEILAFKKEWGNRSPVVIVPTKYYSTPTEVFRTAGISTVIWANHLLRTSISAMQQTAKQLHKEQTLTGVEDRVATVAEIFRLQGADELQEAEKKYLPGSKDRINAVVLAASQGKELGVLTADKPKALIPISGKPLLHRLLDTLNSVGIKDITVVRGFKKDLINLPKLHYVDNDEFESTHEVYSLFKGVQGLTGSTLITYGDVLFQKYIPMSLVEKEGDFVIAVDVAWEESRNKGRYADLVSCDRPYRKEAFDQTSLLKTMGPSISQATTQVHGEWMGLIKLSGNGLRILQDLFQELSPGKDPKTDLRKMRMSALFNILVQRGKKIDVVYTQGHWLDVDDMKDVVDAGTFAAGEST